MQKIAVIVLCYEGGDRNRGKYSLLYMIKKNAPSERTNAFPYCCSIKGYYIKTVHPDFQNQ